MAPSYRIQIILSSESTKELIVIWLVKRNMNYQQATYKVIRRNLSHNT